MLADIAVVPAGEKQAGTNTPFTNTPFTKITATHHC
jgi:hypothetical protein